MTNMPAAPGERIGPAGGEGTEPAAGAIPGVATGAMGAASTVGAAGIVRGVLRLLASMDYRPLVEFPLPDGRRADVAALDPRGGILIVEVKSSLADFRSDGKWPHYRDWCDAFCFAVDPDFPHAVLPDDAGLIVADRFAGVLVRSAPALPLASARRRALLLRFARTAAGRLAAIGDPDAVRATGWGEPGR